MPVEENDKSELKSGKYKLLKIRNQQLVPSPGIVIYYLNLGKESSATLLIKYMLRSHTLAHHEGTGSRHFLSVKKSNRRGGNI